MIQKPYLFNLHNIHPSTGESPHAFACTGSAFHRYWIQFFKGSGPRDVCRLHRLWAKKCFCCFSLDIQSYLLRFGVLGIFGGSKYLLNKCLDVQGKRKNTPGTSKPSIFMLRKKSWMEFSLFPLNPWSCFKERHVLLEMGGLTWLDPPTPNAPGVWIPQNYDNFEKAILKGYSMLDFLVCTSIYHQFWAKCRQIVQSHGAGRLDFIIRFSTFVKGCRKFWGPDTQITITITGSLGGRYIYLYGWVVFFHDRCKQHKKSHGSCGFFVTFRYRLTIISMKKTEGTEPTCSLFFAFRTAD